MGLIFRAPLTENGNDIISGTVPTTPYGAVTFSAEGALFSSGNMLLYTGMSPATMTQYSLSLWVKHIASTTSFLMGNFMYRYHAILTLPSIDRVYIGGTGPNKDYTPATYSPDTHAHMVLTVNSGVLNGCALYVNGVSRGAFTGTVYADTGFDTLAIGGSRLSSSYRQTKAYMLDARKYDHALSTQEIQELYLAGPNGGIEPPSAQSYSFVIGGGL